MSDRVFFYLPFLAWLLELRQGPDPISEGAEMVGEIARLGMENAGNCVTSVLPKVACLASGQSERGFLLPEEGVEPS